MCIICQIITYHLRWDQISYTSYHLTLYQLHINLYSFLSIMLVILDINYVLINFLRSNFMIQISNATYIVVSVRKVSARIWIAQCKRAGLTRAEADESRDRSVFNLVLRENWLQGYLDEETGHGIVCAYILCAPSLSVHSKQQKQVSCGA